MAGEVSSIEIFCWLRYNIVPTTCYASVHRYSWSDGKTSMVRACTCISGPLTVLVQRGLGETEADHVVPPRQTERATWRMSHGCKREMNRRKRLDYTPARGTGGLRSRSSNSVATAQSSGGQRKSTETAAGDNVSTRSILRNPEVIYAVRLSDVLSVLVDYLMALHSCQYSFSLVWLIRIGSQVMSVVQYIIRLFCIFFARDCAVVTAFCGL